MPSEITLDIRSIEGLERPEAARPDRGGAGFARELGRAVGELDAVQVAADEQANAVARGAGNLHEMAIALEKADVAMKLALKVRNKVVETYNEIMRMSV